LLENALPAYTGVLIGSTFCMKLKWVNNSTIENDFYQYHLIGGSLFYQLHCCHTIIVAAEKKDAIIIFAYMLLLTYIKLFF
jgi:hypothetical protein